MKSYFQEASEIPTLNAVLKKETSFEKKEVYEKVKKLQEGGWRKKSMFFWDTKSEKKARSAPRILI